MASGFKNSYTESSKVIIDIQKGLYHVVIYLVNDLLKTRSSLEFG